MALEDELRRDIDSYQSKARISYRTAYCLSLVAVLSSFVAGLSVAGEWFPKTALAVLSSLPAAILIASDRFKFEERASWHYRMTYSLKALLNELLYEGRDPASVSAERRKIDEDLQPLWPGFGSPPSPGM